MISCFNRKKLGDFCLPKNVGLGFGKYVPELEERFREISCKEHNIATCSGSMSAYMIFQYLMEKHGYCQIYIPSLSFCSVAWAALSGSLPVFTDVDSNLLLDSNSVNNHTNYDGQKIVMFLGYGGNSIPDYYNLENSIIVEDASHCIKTSEKADFSFFSFYPTKPINASAGGMISTDDGGAAEYFYRFRNFGRECGEVDYEMVQEGTKLYMDNLNAAMVLSQLSGLQDKVEYRKANYGYLTGNIYNSKYIERFIPHQKDSSHYLCTAILKEPHRSQNFRKYYKRVEFTFHYPYLHDMWYFRNCLRSNMPVLDCLKDRIINIPIHEGLSTVELDQIIEEIS